MIRRASWVREVTPASGTPCGDDSRRGVGHLALPAPNRTGAFVVALDLRTHEAVAEQSGGRRERIPPTPHRAVGDVARDVLAAVRPRVPAGGIDPPPHGGAPPMPPLAGDEPARHTGQHVLRTTGPRPRAACPARRQG